MPPPINLSNVNISIAQFQEVSSGEHNAGEVKLTGEHSIDKVNHFVSRRGKNTVSQSAAEVLALKNAFVRALSNGGVDAAELARVRRDLGLQPREPVDRNLRTRSIKPLTRQQVREILDRNAAILNATHGPGTVRTSAELYAGLSPQTLADRKTARDRANSELSARRDIEQNERIAVFQRVIAGDVDFRSDASAAKFLEMARRMLDVILVRSGGHPREGVPAEMTWKSGDGGQKVVMDTGLDEAAFARKLEEIIVRLQNEQHADPVEREVRARYGELSTDEERVAFVANLQNEQQCALKARALVVKFLFDRGITDPETLSLPNRLREQDALALLANLVSSARGLHGDELRHCAAMQSARAQVDPGYRPRVFATAYVPTLTDERYNFAIVDALLSEPGKLPETYRLMALRVTDEVRARYGEKGLPDGADITRLSGSRPDLSPTGTPRFTPDTLRPVFREKAIAKAADSFLLKDIAERLARAGQDPGIAIHIVIGLTASKPQLMERLLAAESPAAAHAIVDDYADAIADITRRYTASERCRSQVAGWAREALAARLGIPAAHLAGGVVDTNRFATSDAAALADAIATGGHPASTEAEIEAAFRDLAAKWADERATAFAQIDALDIPADAKDALKTSLLTMENVRKYNVAVIAEAARRPAVAANVALLAERLAAGAPPADIYAVMTELSLAAREAGNENFAAARAQGKRIGPDEYNNAAELFIQIAVLSKPGLDRKIADFLQQAAARGDNFYDGDRPEKAAMAFLSFQPAPDGGEPLAARLGKPTLPPLHAQALVEAVREEGLEGFTAEEALALFGPGKPAGKKLAETLSIDPSPRPTAFKLHARAALRVAKPAILAARAAEAAARAAERAFLEGDGAARALAAGYHRSELPGLARAYGLYKTAADATDEAALQAILDPQSKARRLASRGGRFTASVENFRAGLALLDAFHAWFATQTAAVVEGKNGVNTRIPAGASPTVANADISYFKQGAAAAYEKFIFEHLAIDETLPLDPANPDAVFAMENNPVTRYVGRGYTNGCTNTFAQIPPEKRVTVFAVFDLVAPLARDVAGYRANNAPNFCVNLLARILANLDEIERMRTAGTLTKQSFCERFFPELPGAAGMTLRQMETAQTTLVIEDLLPNRLGGNFGAVTKLTLTLQTSGCTLEEALAAQQQNRSVPPAPYVAAANGAITALDGTAAGGRAQAVADLRRPDNPHYRANNQRVFEAADNVFVAVFPDGTTLRSSDDATAEAIADKVAALCGPVHPAQLNAVYYAISQSAATPVISAFADRGLETSEHMPLTYTLSKDADTGAITVRYSQPAGFPHPFHWTTTIHLDGTTSTTPLVLDPPPPPNP